MRIGRTVSRWGKHNFDVLVNTNPLVKLHYSSVCSQLVLRPAVNEPPVVHWSTWEAIESTVGPDAFLPGADPTTVGLAFSINEANHFARNHMREIDFQFLIMDYYREMVLDRPQSRMRGYRVLWITSHATNVYIIVGSIRTCMMQFILQNREDYPGHPPPAPPGCVLITLRYHTPLPGIVVPDCHHFFSRCLSPTHTAEDTRRCPVVLARAGKAGIWIGFENVCFQRWWFMWFLLYKLWCTVIVITSSIVKCIFLGILSHVIISL